MQSTYMKNYRAAKKAKETESEKLSRQIKKSIHEELQKEEKR